MFNNKEKNTSCSNKFLLTKNQIKTLIWNINLTLSCLFKILKKVTLFFKIILNKISFGLNLLFLKLLSKK